MAHDREEDFLRVLRWMRENIDVSSSIYRTKSRGAAVDPTVRVDASGNPRRSGSGRPADYDDAYLNSVVGLTGCCYMGALGKVLLRGKGGHRLNAFAAQHMPDLKAECDTKGGRSTLQTLYKVYRCGFVHQFASSDMAWSRQGGRAGDYWFALADGKPGLNIDRFAEGLIRGIDSFEAWFKSQVVAGPTTYKDFFEWLDAD